MSAAVVKVVQENNERKKGESTYQHEMRELFSALKDGTVPELSKAGPDGPAHAQETISGASSSPGQAWGTSSTGAAPGADSPRSKQNKNHTEVFPAEVECELFTYVFMDEDEEGDEFVNEAKIQVPKASIPSNAVIEHKSPSFGRYATKLEICGVVIPPFLWQKIGSRQYKGFVFYNCDMVQFFTAGLIFGNFIVNAAEAQVRENEGAELFKGLEMFFTCIFTFELGINFYAHKYSHFVNSWNIFDTVVVLVSLLSLALDNLPGISTLRLMRAFRVFRLFKRLASLRKIMAALSNSVPGCSNAFAIVILVTSIYSILGVQFFKEVGEGDQKGRYFGTFLRAMLTMFQVMTGDSWAEGVSRPTMEHYPDNGQRVMVQLFFVSYILLVGIVLTNVVVAVLLEKMTMDDDIEEVPEEEMLKGNTDNQFKELVTALAFRLNSQDNKIDELTKKMDKMIALSKIPK